MSNDLENRARIYHTNIEESFKSLGAIILVESEEILTAAVEAYKADLADMDAKTRILDDIIAITTMGGEPEDKYRKIAQVLLAKGKASS